MEDRKWLMNENRAAAGWPQGGRSPAGVPPVAAATAGRDTIQPEINPTAGRVLEWLRRPQRGVRTMLLLMLAVSLVCSLMVSIRRHYLALSQEEIAWIPYNSATLAHCREIGVPVIVVYAFPFSTTEYLWAVVPFDDRELAKHLNAMGIVAMNTAFYCYDATERPVIQRDVSRLGGEMPIIVIYDSQRGDVVIPPRNEGFDERAKRVGKLLWEYAKMWEEKR